MYVYIYIYIIVISGLCPYELHLPTPLLDTCYSEVTAYTALAYSYWTHPLMILTVAAVSRHITPLKEVINSHKDRHTHMHTDIRRYVFRNRYKKPGAHPVHPLFLPCILPFMHIHTCVATQLHTCMDVH